MRNNPDENFDRLSKKEVEERLYDLGELSTNQSLEDMKAKLKIFERTRHLIPWLDNSSVANHGHLVGLITCLYDPSVFYTSQEFAVKMGRWVDIQCEAETPEVYFIARCRSSDQDQLAYCETRLECVQQLKVPVAHNGIEYQDVMRLSHADSPQRAHETGQQKDGHYFCSCGVHCDRTYELDHVLNCELRTILQKKQLVLKGTVTRKNSLQKKGKPLSNLSRPEMECELASRGVFKDGNVKVLQRELDSIEGTLYLFRDA